MGERGKRKKEEKRGKKRKKEEKRGEKRRERGEQRRIRGEKRKQQIKGIQVILFVQISFKYFIIILALMLFPRGRPRGF